MEMGILPTPWLLIYYSTTPHVFTNYSVSSKGSGLVGAMFGKNSRLGDERFLLERYPA